MGELDKKLYARATEAALLREKIKAGEEERRALQGPLSLAHQALVAAQEALNAAQSRYDCLLAIDEQLKLRIHVARAPLHPVRKLPDEILREIFLAWRSNSGSSVGRRAASVCRWWRRVALSLPFLWRDINVVFGWRLSRSVDVFLHTLMSIEPVPAEYHWM